jgi:hypothetical protein
VADGPEHQWGHTVMRRLPTLLLALFVLLVVPAAAPAANPITDNPITDAAGGAWDWAGAEVGAAAGSVARSGVDALSAWAASGAAWIIQQALAAAASTSNPAVTAPWFSQAYARMWLVAGMLGALCATLGLAQAAVRGDGRMLARVFASLPVGAVVTGGAAALTSLLLRATDELSAWLLVGSGGGLGRFGAQLSAALIALPAEAPLLAFLVGIVGALVALMVWVELLIRGALVYVLLGFLPLVSAVVIWPAAGGAMRKLLRLLLVTILSKLVIAGVLALGLASLTAAGDGGVGAGVEQVLAGVAMLALAAASPLTAYRLLPFFEEHAQQRGGLSAGKAARTAGSLVASPMVGGAGRVAGAGSAMPRGNAGPLPVMGNSR